MKDIHRINQLRYLAVFVVCLLALFGLHIFGLAQAKSVTIPDQSVMKSSSLYRYPGRYRIGSTARWAHFHGIMHIKQIGYYHGVKYDYLVRWGRNLGWANAGSLRQPKLVMLPYVYTSQFWPSPADDACEAASLKMALSVKGKALNVPLARMVRRIPHSNSPYRGYTHNPFRWGTGASIYPTMLSRVARTYGVNAHRILPRNAKPSLFKWYIQHGDPVVFEGSHGMRNTGSDHVLALLGWKPGYFWYADPESHSEANWGSGWVSYREFMRVFSRKVSGKRAMVVLSK